MPTSRKPLCDLSESNGNMLQNIHYLFYTAVMNAQTADEEEAVMDKEKFLNAMRINTLIELLKTAYTAYYGQKSSNDDRMYSSAQKIVVLEKEFKQCWDIFESSEEIAEATAQFSRQPQ